ncbi:MAG: universal stress protein [Flavobacteriales bacterium]|nr:universal stress protein [Flavobacteriales bacterium]
MKKILIPTDFSPNAHKAAVYALRLFGDSARYTLVNAYQVPHSGNTMLISIADILKRDSEQLLKEELIRLEDEFPHLVDHLEILAEMGQPDMVLKKLVVKNGHDLVVMGTKGASGLKGVLVGSVASNVIQYVPCAVLAVPASVEPRLPQLILLAADDHTLSRDKCPDALAYIAGRNDAKVLILNVLKDGESAEAGGRTPVNSFEGIAHTYYFESGNDVGETITNFAKEKGVDMMAMIRRKKDLFANLFGQSNTREMMQSTKLPLLVLPNDQSA